MSSILLDISSLTVISSRHYSHSVILRCLSWLVLSVDEQCALAVASPLTWAQKKLRGEIHHT